MPLLLRSFYMEYPVHPPLLWESDLYLSQGTPQMQLSLRSLFFYPNGT